jgi:hypothetical protein
MRKKQNGYHSQLCELPLYSRLGKLRASRETGFWTLHAQATAYGIAAQQFSSSLHAYFHCTRDLVNCAQAGKLDSGQCMHKLRHMASQLSSSAAHCMHTILHMRSQLSSSAVHCMHKILHMGSQFSSSAVQQFGTCTRYCIWDRSSAAQQFSSSAVHCMHKPLHMGSQFHKFSSSMHAQDTANGIAVQQLSNTVQQQCSTSV